MIYLDNAATSWPKPPQVIAAMERFLRECGANPGRSGHAMSIQAGRVVFEARQRIARLFGHPDPLSVVFTKNATEAINLVLFGLLTQGDHVITSTMEHNSILRPLRYLQGRGVEVTRVGCGSDGVIDPGDVEKAISGRTRVVILGDASNVTGTLCPIEEISSITRRHELLFCLDAAQTGGVRPLDMGTMPIDLLVFTGHKALYGPQGTGGLCIGDRARNELAPLLHGGTGSASHLDEQPDFLPDRLEAGTLNAVGLAGLAAGVEVVQTMGVEEIARKEEALTSRLVEGLLAIPSVTLLGPHRAESRIGVVSFNLAGTSCSDLAVALEEDAGICCRAGLHCAPMAHQQLGTYPEGALRLSLGMFNNESEIDITLRSLEKIAERYHGKDH